MDYTVAEWAHEKWFVKSREDCNAYCEEELGVSMQLVKANAMFSYDPKAHKCGGWIYNSRLRYCSLKKFLVEREADKRIEQIDGGYIEYHKKIVRDFKDCSKGRLKNAYTLVSL